MRQKNKSIVVISLIATFFTYFLLNSQLFNREFTNVFASTYGDFTYNDSTITEYLGDSDIVIVPGEINGETITSIGIKAFKGCENIREIELPDSISTIDNNAFADCSNLESINIPPNVESIGPYAFQNCISLKAMELSDKLSILEDMAFFNCTSLESVKISGKINVITNSTFQNCTSLESVILPDSITEIKARAFYNCINLKTINIPKKLSSIGSHAFYYCENLTTINLPEELSSIGEMTFYSCKNLESVNLSDNIYKIPENAFNNCMKLKAIDLPENLSSIGKSAFQNCTELQTVSIPEDVTNIPSFAFSKCSNLTSVTMPGVTTIDESAFSYCSSLDTLDLSNVTLIGNKAFESCENLKNVDFNSDVALQNDSFNSCPSFNYINQTEVKFYNNADGSPYFDEFDEFIKNNFNGADNVGFINSFIIHETKYIVSQITTEEMTDIQKAVALHDWVCNKVVYDYDDAKAFNNKNHVDVSIFLNDSTVCAGYAKGYCLLLQAAGIESYCISGNANSGIAHAWNIIKLGDHYFNADCCWDDNDNGYNYDYFLLSDAEILKSRKIGNISAVTSTLYNFVQTTRPTCKYSMGDLNLDESVIVDDAALLQKYLVRKSSVAEGDMILADINHDGNVNVFDLILLKRTIAK